MKNIFFAMPLIMFLIFTGAPSHAQVSVKVNINLQPDWGPIGYDYVEYYYIPQYEVYYYVPKRQFVYLDNGRWIFASTLPSRFGVVNLYTPYKIIINEPKAYLHFNDHKVKYVKYKGGGEKQVIIRDSNDPKYEAAKKNNGHGNDNNASPKQSDNKGKDNKKENPKEDNKPK